MKTSWRRVTTIVDEYSARPSRLVLSLLAVALGLGWALTAVPAVRHWREVPPAPPPTIRATWTPPVGVVVGAGEDYPFGLVLAPDGRRAVFPGGRDGHTQLWVQDLATGVATALPGTDRGVLPFWSADGGRIAFFADGSVKAITVSDRRIVELARVARPRGGTWNGRGEIVFTNDEGGLSLVSAGQSEGQGQVTTVDGGAGERAHLFPAFVDDTHLVVLIQADSLARQGLYLVSTSDGTRTRLTGASTSAVPADGQLLYANSGSLVSQELDLTSARLVGRPEVLAARVGESPSGQLLASAAADAVVFSDPVSTQHELVWFARDGSRLGTVGTPGDYWQVRVAPDGRRVAVTTREPLLRTLDIVQFDGRTVLPSRVSLSIDADEWPAWSPDGLRVAWVQGGRAVMIRGAGAVLPAETLTRFDEPTRVTDWTADGRNLVVSRSMADTRDDLWLVPVRGTGPPQQLVSTPFADVQGTISPDGRRVAYASDESGVFEVYVEGIMDRSPEPATRERVSSGGGSDPRWSRGGQELFFRRGPEIHVATPALGRGQNAVAATSMVFRTEVAPRSFDVGPDGQRFLLSVPAATPPAPATLLLHWRQPKVTTTGP